MTATIVERSIPTARAKADWLRPGLVPIEGHHPVLAGRDLHFPHRADKIIEHGDLGAPEVIADKARQIIKIDIAGLSPRGF